MLAAAVERLRERAGDDARLEAELLLAHALGRPRSALLGGPAVSAEAAERFAALLEERVTRARPLAHLVGRRGFWDLELLVDARVLVPRPETERLVELLFELDDAGALPAGAVADRGTGSGALALTAAARRPVLAVERSADALAVAAANRAELAAGRGGPDPADARARARRVLLVHGVGLDAARPGSLAAVLANPPYVRPAEHVALAREVREHEPREALVPRDGDVSAEYARVAAEARAALRPGGWLLMEVGAGDAQQALARLAQAGLEARGSARDLAGVERVVRGYRPR